MSIKLAQTGAKQFAKGIKKAAKDCPELMQSIIKNKPEALKTNGKLSTKALRKSLINSDLFTPSGKMVKGAQNEIKEFMKEEGLSNKISLKKLIIAMFNRME